LHKYEAVECLKNDRMKKMSKFKI